MLYYLLYPLRDVFSFFNIFRYITFRAVMAALFAFLISLLAGPSVIAAIKRLSIGQQVRKEDSKKLHELHGHKQGTPTMGGILILIAVVLSTLLWSEFENRYIQLVLLCTLWLGVTGFADDYLKHIRKCSKGLTATAKFTSQITLGLVLGAVLFLDPQHQTTLDIPFLKDVSIELGIFYIVLVILVITGTSNAVNLTDGLDGLAIGSVVMAAVAFTILCYVSGNARLSDYLLIPFIKGSGELTIFCASLVLFAMSLPPI